MPRFVEKYCGGMALCDGEESGLGEATFVVDSTASEGVEGGES